MVLSNIDLDWSFRPLTSWLKFTTGIHLQDQNNNGKIRFRQLFCLMLSIISQIFLIRQFFYDIVPAVQFLKPNDRLTMTRMWNVAIDYINWTVVSLSTHFLLFFIVRPRWSNLMCLYRRSTALFGLQFYTDLRRLSFLGVSYVFLFVSLYKFFKFLFRFLKKTIFSLHRTED